MIIALDYGKTYSADPPFWDKFIALAKSSGHQIICVTLRPISLSVNMPCEILYTDGEKKLKYMTRLGRKVDIWIDDWPATIE